MAENMKKTPPYIKYKEEAKNVRRVIKMELSYCRNKLRY